MKRPDGTLIAPSATDAELEELAEIMLAVLLTGNYRSASVGGTNTRKGMRGFVERHARVWGGSGGEQRLHLTEGTYEVRPKLTKSARIPSSLPLCVTTTMCNHELIQQHMQGPHVRAAELDGHGCTRASCWSYFAMFGGELTLITENPQDAYAMWLDETIAREVTRRCLLLPLLAGELAHVPTWKPRFAKDD